MLIFPAMDIRAGRVVRSAREDISHMTVYDKEPLEVAWSFVRLGATCMHINALDGGRDGASRNRSALRALCELPLAVQVQGQVRGEADVEALLSLGVSRAVLSTEAALDIPLAGRLAQKYGDKLVVGVHVRDGLVTVPGRQEDARGAVLCERLRDAGVTSVVYTDISWAGRLMGVNLAIYEEIAGLDGLRVIASGGVSHEVEIQRLREMNLYGVILGKALYTGRLSLVRTMAIGKGEMIPF